MEEKSRLWRWGRRTSGAGERHVSVDDIPIMPVNTTARRLYMARSNSGAMLPGWANLMWKAGGDLYDYLSVRLLRVDSTDFTIPVSEKFYLGLNPIAEFHLLVVRYGTDEALQESALPTERDKVDGRRKLTSEPVSLHAKYGHYYLSFNLPVHAYLGTQFKLYATEKNGHNIEQVQEALKKVSLPTPIRPHGRSFVVRDCLDNFAVKLDLDRDKPAKTMCVGRGGPQFERVSFLIDKFRSTLSAGGHITNNFVGPGGR